MKNHITKFISSLLKNVAIKIAIIFCLLFSTLTTNAANYYWVNGTGNWSDYANHWATTSGGVIFHTTVPGPSDDVFFDGNSFLVNKDKVTVDLATIYFNNMDWTGATLNPIFSAGTNTLNISGSLIFIKDMKATVKQINLTSTSTGNILTTAKVKLGYCDINFNGIGGEWTLTDSLVSYNVYLNFYNGTFNTGNNYVECLNIKKFPGSFVLYVGTSKIKCGNWDMGNSTNLILNAANARFFVDDFTADSGQLYDSVTASAVYSKAANFNQITSNSFSGSKNTVNRLNVFSFGGDSNNITFCQFYLASSSGVLNGEGNNFTKCIFNGEAEIKGVYNHFQAAEFFSSSKILKSNTFDTLTFNNTGIQVVLHDTVTINNQFNANGSCNGLIYFQSDSTGKQACIKMSAGIVVSSFIYLKDIKAFGGASFTATNAFNAGNVSGWTINILPPKNLYWVGGKGNWSDINHWSLTSGGTGGSCIPTPADNVYFDQNSFTLFKDEITIDLPKIYCNNMDWTGATNKPQFVSGPGVIDIYGSLILINIMKFNMAEINFKSNAIGNTFTTAGLTFPGSIFNFDGNGGEWFLMDTLISWTSDLNFINGTFNSNSNIIKCENIKCSNNSIVILGTSKITLTQWNGSNTPGSLSAANAVFNADYFHSGNYQNYGKVTASDVYSWNANFNDLTVSSFNGHLDTINLMHGSGTFSGDSNVIADFINSTWQSTINGSFNKFTKSNFAFDAIVAGRNNFFKNCVFEKNVNILKSNTFDSLFFNNIGNQVILKDTVTINFLISASGSCSGMIYFQSDSAGKQAYLKMISGNVVADYIFLKNIHAFGGATFTANNSFNGGNVSGWNINASVPKNLFWVGSTGNWSDVNHWSLSSGGIGGSCIPTPADNVFFDGNSFNVAKDEVTVDLPVIYCNNMDWTGAIKKPKFVGQSNTLNVYGSLTLIKNMNFDIGEFNFMSTLAGNTVTTAMQKISAGDMNFNGIGGQWDILDTIDSYNLNIYILNGTVRTNNNFIRCSGLRCSGSNTTFDIGTSNIFCNDFYAGNSNVNLMAVNSYIKADHFYGGISHQFGRINSGNANAKNATIDILTCTFCSGIDTSNINILNVKSSFGGGYNTVNNLYCYGTGFGGKNNDINKSVFYSDVSVTGDVNHFQHCTFLDAAEISGSQSFDTLYFHNAGKDVWLSDSLTVINELWGDPKAGFPTKIRSKIPGVKANIISTSPNTHCLEYVYLQDINATGGATFYAGDYSIDLGNNTGWIWSGCTPDTSNVWPGDANYDLIADNNDVLYIGLAYGYTGPTRAGATSNWIAQPGVDWLQQFANGSNIKHADCDGNGTINANDTLAVSLNYGLTHPFKPTIPNDIKTAGVPLYFDLPSGALIPGSTVSIPIMFGNAMQAVSNLYGIAFTINYDPAFVQAGSMQIDFSNSWLGNNLNTLHLTKDFYATGSIDMGYVKTDHINTSGNGQFATLTFTVANGVSGLTNLSFSKIFAIDKNEIPIAVTPIDGSVYTSLHENAALQNMIAVYPNPATNIIHINDLNNVVTSLKLIDRIGKEIYTEKISGNKTEINVAAFDEGLYILQLETTLGIVTKKILLLR